MEASHDRRLKRAAAVRSRHTGIAFLVAAVSAANIRDRTIIVMQKGTPMAEGASHAHVGTERLPQPL